MAEESFEEKLVQKLDWVEDRIYDNQKESQRLQKMAEQMYADHQNDKSKIPQPDSMLHNLTGEMHLLSDKVDMILNYLKLLGLKAGVPFVEENQEIK